MPKPTKVRSHGNNVRDIIIAHVISADAQIYRHRNGKVILGPAGRARSMRLAGKSSCERTFEYAGAEKQTAKKVGFVIFVLSHAKLLTSIAYKLKQLSSYFTHRMTLLSLY